MKRATDRKLASSKSEHGAMKRINEMATETIKVNLQFIILLSVFCTISAVDVFWEATIPVFFGDVAYLQCQISQDSYNCTRGPRQWYGGPYYDSLCYEDTCVASNKYEVMTQSTCQYTLMIRDFSDQDVNCEYTCLYGISKMRRNLTLDEKKFIYEPHVEDIKEDTLEKDKTLHWRINISRIFPKPLCGADLNGKRITDHLQISVAKPRFYFTADLQINLPSSSCGKLDVYCYLGDYKINITSKNFDSCDLQGSENSNSNGRTVFIAVIICTILLVVSGVMFCIYKKGIVCFYNNNYNRRVQYRPTQN